MSAGGTVDQGLLIPHGEKRGRYYVASSLVEEIEKASQPPNKCIPDPYEQLALDLDSR